ncbi:DUF3099 domain-containing protein [Kineococcus esterisolvens]|uniref:DUF3099 domain-containing protein n=1 Tax=unclassified Kineococcus TaxID=2621656 RepID=UPI003D7C5531
MPSHPTPAGGHTAHTDPAGVYRITAAPTAHTDDLGVRYRKYVVSMVIRTACFVLFVLVDHWTRWLFVAGALFLPYVAVVLANAGRESKGPPPQSFDVPDAPVRDLPALEARITSVRSPGDDASGAPGAPAGGRSERAS